MRRVTLALVLALAAGCFATASTAAPTAPPETTPIAKPKPTAQQRALRACAKMKDDQAKAACQRRAQAQTRTPRKAIKRPPSVVTPAAAPQN